MFSKKQKVFILKEVPNNYGIIFALCSFLGVRLVLVYKLYLYSANAFPLHSLCQYSLYGTAARACTLKNLCEPSVPAYKMPSPTIILKA